MEEYIKLFQNHTQYEAYKNSANYVTPNVSYCEQQDEVHYNPWAETRLITTFDIDINDFDDSDLRLYFDDFPVDKCEDEYDGDMAAFKQEAIDFIDDGSPEELNEYRYTGETYEYDGEEYYLWESTNEEQTYLKYLLTDRLDFTGLSLEENINADYCPFIYILDEDSEIVYDNTDHPQYYLVAVRSSEFDIDILFDDSNVDKIEIDGNILPDIVTSYTFNTPGKHIVKYTLSDPSTVTELMFNELSYLQSVNIPDSVTSIEHGAFSGCSDLVEVAIPNFVTSIGDWAFGGCSGLTSITIPNSVTSIESRAFYNCSGLTSIICNATTGPTIYAWTFYNVKIGGTLYVPIGSSGYNTWMSTENYYLGKYNWTKVEQ